jgi:HAE1 family hydrophobic/amphiphilic exporter-1
MWFTRVSLQNPVFATMVMLALVVMGIFSFQRLKVDQFPNIDFPVVVISTEYPGASPEIVESEVSKKIEEGVNSIAGISALTSRSYENQSVVIMEFQLQIDGRKAAEDVREKVASLRPLLRTEVKEPRVLRFDPSSRAVWSLAVIPEGDKLNAVELTNWSEQVLKKRLENVRGVGSVTLVGGSKREINLYLNPANMEALGVTAEQVVAAVRNENQDLPVGAIRSLQQERMVQISSRMERPEDFGRIIVARKNGSPIRLSQVATVQDGAQELENLALYNGQLTLPISLIGTFMFMQMFGFTINMITLMALSLCVGLLIDDAIVVRENIVRHVQMGKNAYKASLEGTQEIGLAVLATTLSIVAVFLPIGFMEGIIGKFFHEFGITIVAAVMISMFVSFTLDPMLSSIWHDPAIDAHGKNQAPVSFYDKTIGRVTGWFDRSTERLADGYQSILRWALVHKKSTVLLALAIFVASVFMVRFLGTEFVPKADFSETSLKFETPVGTSLEATEAKTRQVEAILRDFPEVRYTVSTINTANAQGKNNVNLYIRLVDRKNRNRNADQMSAVLRERLKQVPGIAVTHAGLLDAIGGNKQVEFSLQGPDQKELERLAVLALAKVRDIPGLVDLDSSVKPNKPVIGVEVLRDAASDLGLGTAQLAVPLRTLVAGQTVGNWRAPDDQTYDVNVRLSPEARNSPQDLERLPFMVAPAADGSPRIVRLGQVAKVSETTGSNQINRRDMMREVAINANVFGRSAGEVSADVRKAMDSLNLPPGYRYSFGGSTKNMAESFGYALSALAMAVIFIYMILASQFKSFLQPLALMTSLPLTLIGVVLALMAFRSTLSMFSIIGVIMLMGLVTKNAILLVDFAIRAREDGLERSEALLLAAKVRLRPILMTTLAMIFGMVPLAFALSEGAEQRAPMGQAVIGGVITSSLLTLVVVPVVYCYMDDLAQWLRAKAGLAPARQAQDTSAP